MNDKQVIGYSVAAIVVLMAVGVWVVLKVTAPPKPTQAVTEVSPSTTRPARSVAASVSAGAKEID